MAHKKHLPLKEAPWSHQAFRLDLHTASQWMSCRTPQKQHGIHRALHIPAKSLTSVHMCSSSYATDDYTDTLPQSRAHLAKHKAELLKTFGLASPAKGICNVVIGCQKLNLILSNDRGEILILVE